MWTACDVPLVTGSNNITVTAFDAADRVASQTRNGHDRSAAHYQLQSPLRCRSPFPSPSPTTAVVTVKTSTISVSGTSLCGGAGITQVKWQTSNGATGVATGVAPWVATGIPVLEGTTTIVLRAYDVKGASAWVALVAVRP